MTMTSEQAQAVMLERVYAPRFIEKCAARGRNIQDPTQLTTALSTVAELKIMKQAKEAKGGDVFTKAAHALAVARYGEDAVKRAEAAHTAQATQDQAGKVQDETVKQAIAALFPTTEEKPAAKDSEKE